MQNATISRTIKTRFYTVTYVTPDRDFETILVIGESEKEATKKFASEHPNMVVFRVELSDTVESRYTMSLEKFINNSEKLEKPNPDMVTKTIKTCAYSVRKVHRYTEEFTTVIAHTALNANEREKLAAFCADSVNYAVVRTERAPDYDVEELRGMTVNLFVSLADREAE